MSSAGVANKPLTGKTFGERLREARDRIGMTQDDLAEAAGINRVNLSRYENGRVMPTVDLAWRLADALGVSLDALRGAPEDET